MEKERIVHISNLTKSFGDHRVIEDISFSLFQGENLVLLGRSGTGKSVIMKCIVGLMEPDSGEVNVFGKDIRNCSEREMSEIRTRIGYLFQEGALYDSMNIRENLLFPARRNRKLMKLSEKELQELVERNLESVGLADAVDKMPGELSGGMKKRAGLARTLMLSPEMIIYDEPTTGLDPFTSEAINELILKVRQEFRTSAIIITHDIKCAEVTGDRLLLLHNGNIVAEGTIDALRRHPDAEVRNYFK
jgi:phospholipid/cholesterol/gamma-HCH transport system ATP-binding protein